MYDIPCVIFAGGKSSRMGEDKALLPFDGFDTLTQFQLNKLSKIFKNVYISCKSKDKFDFSANFIEDLNIDYIYAPTVGFVSVFEKLKCESFFIISVDTPFVDQQIISELIEADNSSVDATVAKTDNGLESMCGIYHKSLLKSFKEMLEEDNHKLQFLLKNSKLNTVFFENKELFLNLNNPEQYKQALSIIQ